jgi:antirestriction protein ArdC
MTRGECHGGRLKQPTEKENLMPTKPQRSFSEEEKAAWRAAKQQRLVDLGEQLKAQVARVQDSDAFKRYLAAQAVFHRYSARNVFLILYQLPTASRVAGYTSWQKLGRQVRRGEAGITIFAPAPFKQTRTDTTTGEVTEKIIPRFKTATVFDYSQTIGEPLPTIKLGEIAGSAPSGAYAVLVDFATSIGYTMVSHPEDDEAEGRCNYEQHTISVQAGDPARMLHILIHELAHALTAATRQSHDRTERETIAEGVAFVACTAIGLNAGGYAFPYIAGYADRKDGAAIITRLMDTIQKTAAVMIETIETQLLGEHTDSEEAEEAAASLAAFERT